MPTEFGTCWALLRSACSPDTAAARPVLDSLKQALFDRDLGVRVQVARALWLIDHQTEVAIPILSESLTAEDEVLRWMAADCLGDIGPRAAAAVPALQSALQANFDIAHVRTGFSIALDRIQQKAAHAGSHLQLPIWPQLG